MRRGVVTTTLKRFNKWGILPLRNVYKAWLDNLPDSLQAIWGYDFADLEPPRGFGRD